MEISLGQWLLILFLVVVPLLYEWSATFKYFCKMAFYNSYILFLAVIVIPVCALRGRNVENMKIIRSMLVHVKYLYGIKIDVRGIENFNIKEPYVVVSNHQSSLDLLEPASILAEVVMRTAPRNSQAVPILTSYVTVAKANRGLEVNFQPGFLTLI
uniref:Uncharacterized protein n=1 Tax=Sphaerodactylus townsendi TaxID=933632 RepID=A0ACB8EFL9_9SAUR